MERKFTLLVSLILTLFLQINICEAQNQQRSAHTITSNIVASTDDAEEILSSGVVDLNSTDLELINDTDGDQIVGLRFLNIDIPQGATINNAFILFESDESDATSTSLIISAEDVDNASTFKDSINDISSRTQTTASVSWSNVEAWSTSVGSYVTPDISTVIQEIVNRGGWANNNSIAILIEGSGKRVAESVDGSVTEAPILVIEYIPAIYTFDCADGVLANPEFELGLASWSTTPTVVKVSNDAFFGDSAVIIDNGNGGGSQNFNAVEDEVYTLKFHAKKTANATSLVELKFKNSLGATLAETELDITTDYYSKYQMSLIAPANTDYVQVTFWQSSNVGATTLDGFCLSPMAVTAPVCATSSCDVESSYGNYFWAMRTAQSGNNWLGYDLGGVILCDNEDGTITLKGNLINGKQAAWEDELTLSCDGEDAWVIEMLMYDMQTWDEFQGSYEQRAGCDTNRFDWDFWNVNGTLTGIGCNAGRTIDINGPSNGYRLQVGWGGNSNTCDFGMSTWFNTTENGQYVGADIYAHIDSACYMSIAHPTPSCSSNEINNGSFENGAWTGTDVFLPGVAATIGTYSWGGGSPITDWFHGPVYWVETNKATDGNRVLYLDKPTGGAVCAGQYYDIGTAANEIQICDNAEYLLTFDWASFNRNTPTGSATISEPAIDIVYFDSNGNQISVVHENLGTPTANQDWNNLVWESVSHSFTMTAPSGATRIRVNVSEGNQSNGVLIDNISFCTTKICTVPTINSVAVSSCIDQPLMDIATVDVEVAWNNAFNNFIDVTIGNKTESIDISGLTSPQTVQFLVEADGSTGNTVSVEFQGDGNSYSTTFNAPSACSNNQIGCDVLYIMGANKQIDGQPFDYGFSAYIDNINGSNTVTKAYAKADATGYGLYNPFSTNTLLSIDLDDYNLIVISPSTNWLTAQELEDSLKTFNGGILNLNRDLVNDLGMASGNAWVNHQNTAFIDNTTEVVLYNYDNTNPTYDPIVSIGDYDESVADAYLWDGAGDMNEEDEGIFFHYQSTDVLPGITAHGPRTYLGYFMEGLYANQQNGGALPAPSSHWFNPVIHLTKEGKMYLDQAILLASEGCTNCVTTITSGIDAPTVSCAKEDILFTVSPAVNGATYEWSFTGNPTISSTTDPSTIINWDTIGVFQATLKVSKDGCSETYIHPINVTEEVFAVAGPNRAICRGGSAEIGGSPTGPTGANYLWTPNLFLDDNTIANPTATPPVTTTYTVTVTKNGCTKSESVTITVDVSLNPTVEAGFDAAICPADDSVTLGAPANPDLVSYQWSTSSGDIPDGYDSYLTVKPSVTTTYYLYAFTLQKCDATDSVTVTVIPCREICNDGIDNDGDGQVDCADGDCDFVPGCLPPGTHADPSIQAQNYDNWMFGDSIELDFGNGLPSSETGRLIAEQSSTTFSGPNGDMLFFTDGKHIYNSNNQIMENGDSIGGSDGVINSSIAFQDPKNDHKMYLFVTANDNNDGGVITTTTATYSKINIRANGGLGKVGKKNKPISGNSEGLTSIPHANGRDIWVITADKNTSTVYSTRVNSQGQGVQSSVGYTLPLSNPNGFPQEINIVGNAQHNKIAIGCYFDEMLILYEFDNVTGVISGLKEVAVQEKVYGLEFSPDGMYIFISSYSDGSLFQLQVEDAPFSLRTSGSSQKLPLTAADILASRVNISTGLGSYGHLQIGPDGRIYCPIAGVSLGAIMNPNGGGASAGWDASILEMDGARITGALPNFMNGGCFRTSFLLPVELAYFDVTAEGNDAYLQWQTLSELNNDHFVIQRSEDAFTWENIAEVDGEGNSTVSINYNYMDEDLAAGTYYYRLQQTDFDGTNEFSEVKSIEIIGSNAKLSAIEITPNPVNANGQLNINGVNGNHVNVRIVNVNGQIVYENILDERTINLSELSLESGVYIFELQNESVMETKRIVIQK